MKRKITTRSSGPPGLPLASSFHPPADAYLCVRRKAKNCTIFLAHANEDYREAIEIYNKLKQEGLNTWLAEENLLPGQNWQNEIPKVIKQSEIILIFLSNNSVSKRGYVQKEFNLALDILSEIPDDEIFIIPIRLDNCTVPDKFQHLHKETVKAINEARKGIGLVVCENEDDMFKKLGI